LFLGFLGEPRADFLWFFSGDGIVRPVAPGWMSFADGGHTFGLTTTSMQKIAVDYDKGKSLLLLLRCLLVCILDMFEQAELELLAPYSRGSSITVLHLRNSI